MGGGEGIGRGGGGGRGGRAKGVERIGYEASEQTAVTFVTTFQTSCHPATG